MARYGDLDKLAVKWRLASPTQRQNFGEIIESHPTADVVEQIFTEIEKEIEEALKSNYRCKTTDDDVFCRINGKIDALRGVQYFIEELKKKFMEVDDG
jgi:hypothetical protein